MSTAANVARQDEAAEVMHCLQNVLREAAFASTLVQLVLGTSQEEGEIAERIGSSASAENGKGH